ncbi:MAG: hypothetical protein COA53_07995 [Rhodobacteraceae bacterium]|nr:MAG: hypothetical protein COA53_07995 [Paracoccaceae bacterium]
MLVIVGLPLIGVIFSIFGTALPAAIAETDTSFSAAYRRSKGLFLFTFGRLVFGPTLFSIVVIILVAALSTLGIPFDTYSASGEFDSAGTIAAYFLFASRMFSVTLTATVLCKTYLRSVEIAEKPT